MFATAGFGRCRSAGCEDGPVSADLHAEIVLARSVHEVAEFVDAEGWERSPQMFALVRTADLVAAEPALIDQIDAADELTPIAQDPLPDHVAGGSMALDEFLATTSWPPRWRAASWFRRS